MTYYSINCSLVVLTQLCLGYIKSMFPPLKPKRKSTMLHRLPNSIIEYVPLTLSIQLSFVNCMIFIQPATTITVPKNYQHEATDSVARPRGQQVVQSHNICRVWREASTLPIPICPYCNPDSSAALSKSFYTCILRT